MRYEDLNKNNQNETAIKSIKDYLLPLVERNITLRKFDLLKENMDELDFNGIDSLDISPLTVNTINQMYRDVDYLVFKDVCGSRLKLSNKGVYEYIERAIHIFDNPKLTELLIDWNKFETKDLGNGLPVNVCKLDYFFAVFQKLLPSHLNDMISQIACDIELKKIWDNRLEIMVSNVYYWAFKEEDSYGHYNKADIKRPTNNNEESYQKVIDFLTILKPVMNDNWIKNFTDQYIKVDFQNVQSSNILFKDMLSMGYLDIENSKINTIIESRKLFAEKNMTNVDDNHKNFTIDIERIVLSKGMRKTNLRDKVKIL